MSFSDLSKELSASLSKETRKKQGIFFTPDNVRQKIFDKLDEFKLSPTRVLEPSFGSGEFLKDLKQYKNTEVVGVELNKTIFNKVISNYKDHDKYTLVNDDFISFKDKNKYDLIIGNPPYFVTRGNKEGSNIFVIFIKKCIKEHLAKNGVLAFVLPTSFYNCIMYDDTRKYIRENCSILHLENVNAKYIDTAQSTMVMILKYTGETNNDFFLDIDVGNYINPNYIKLNELIDSGSNLNKMKCKVKTGEVVWNQHKDKLTDNKEEGTLVVYSSNVVGHEIVLDNLLGDEKKQYITEYKKEPSEGPVIFVNRGYGNSYIFSYAIIKEGKFYGENHVNMIYSKDEETTTKILKSFEDKRTSKFIKLYTGNGALSKTDLEYILPIFS
jgi:adenine-specific DNA-methyltransferase